MAKLIKQNGNERELQAPTENGFASEDFVRLFGSHIRMVPFNTNIVLVMVDVQASQEGLQRNEKATRIARFALSDSSYEVHGDALLVSREELGRFLEQAGAREDKTQGFMRPSRSTLIWDHADYGNGGPLNRLLTES
jgi:hypothetical protein